MLTCNLPTCVFVDNANLFSCLRAIDPSGQSRFDYTELKKLSEHPRTEVRVYYSYIEGTQEPNKLMFTLEKNKITTIGLPLRQRKGEDNTVVSLHNLLKKHLSEQEILVQSGIRPHVISQAYGHTSYSLEKGLDSEIVADMIDLYHIGKFERFILVSGDEDFARTVLRLRRLGIVVDVALPLVASISSRLSSSASSVIDLSSFVKRKD